MGIHVECRVWFETMNQANEIPGNIGDRAHLIVGLPEADKLGRDLPHICSTGRPNDSRVPQSFVVWCKIGKLDHSALQGIAGLSCGAQLRIELWGYFAPRSEPEFPRQAADSAPGCSVDDDGRFRRRQRSNALGIYCPVIDCLVEQ